MRWNKLGKIFNPQEFKPLNLLGEYAQSPQPVVFDDYIRVFFSTRELDHKGKYLSQVAFVDFDKSFSKILFVSKAKVIELGGLGEFDEHGIFPFNVLRVNDKLYAYTTGWNRKVSVSADASIGLAISENNGLNFKKYKNGPIMTASLNEPFLVCDAFVKIINNVFHMWYIYGTKWVEVQASDSKKTERIYKIAHAISDDGINWQRNSKLIISDKIGPNECQALPSVIKINGTYHMFFCYRSHEDFRDDPKKSYKLGHATSNDLISWHRNDEDIHFDRIFDWDQDMFCYPNVCESNGDIYMLYNGNNFGKCGFGVAKLVSN
jgi:sucrose-6-phosphate hydrolase SacC (GH32 family)